MGAQQSTADDTVQPDGTTQPRRVCYYELLNVDRSASDQEIKSAYRRKALELHPDRNPGDIENSTRKFAEVQNAFETLSDAQERAWYDSHREDILGGDDDGSGTAAMYHDVRMTSAEDIVTLIGRFNPSMSFTDQPDGFFGILNVTFDQLAMEEQAAGGVEGRWSIKYQSFGGAHDGYEAAVQPFYSSWSGFSTNKTFAWKDQYKLSEAPDRRTRRLMEKENKKLRDDAIRTFNDAVRSLVAFVKKRDPRCKLNAQSEVERQKALRDATAAQAARARAANQEKLSQSATVPLWSTVEDDQTEDHEFADSVSEDSEIQECFQCVVCDKIFKSVKQLESHEQSKKHLKALRQLRIELLREGGISPTKDEHTASEEVSPLVEMAPREADESNTASRSSSPPAKPPVCPEACASSSTDDAELPGSEAGVRKLVDAQRRLRLDEAASSTSTDSVDEEKATTVLWEDPVGSGSNHGPSGSKIGKAKAKRQRKAALAAAPTEHMCAVCAVKFASRSQLYKHIKAVGHMQLKYDVASK